MVFKVEWTRRALRDLRDIYNFIAKDSALYARIEVEEMQSVVSNLAEFPEMGRSLPEFKELPYREILKGDYRIIYRYDKDSKMVIVMAVVHGRRLLKQSDVC